MVKIGVQAMMLKQHAADHGAYQIWKRLAESGFSSVEVSQIALTPETRDEIVRANSEFGMGVAAISGGIGPTGGGGNDSLVESFDKIVADCKALGTERVRIGMMPLPAFASEQTLVEAAHTMDDFAGRLADEGIRLSYHNHHYEFARIGERHILDLIRAEAPRLLFEIDVHWVHRGGMDPVRVINNYAGVADLIHLKDYRIGLPPAEAIEGLASGNREAWTEYANNIVQFAEVGSGNLDFPGIIEAAKAAGAAHLLIEQDQQYGRDIFDCLADSRAHLVKIGYESLL
ncbi:sugar phosphate isomerase/epimerase family protein [Microlunatus parietis]|uniref:Sugar phosphate isomerase/epimerase n=1 Tax=Microlunatus parietis TaxID=682979 RepID=A0A7Y9I6M5_9ACTN|nr:TIM barrel protein [Microlunatus parietis]NYE71127.1 sugar phosphate isomerase/epimerase [Microlunatus parietis]